MWGHQTSVITSSMQVQVSTTSCVQEEDPITHRMTQAHQSKVPAKKVQTRPQAKRPLDTNSELAKLLRSDSSVQGLSKRLQDYEEIPCKRQTVLRETICNPSILSRFILIPPPPPGSLPQPQISPGENPFYLFFGNLLAYNRQLYFYCPQGGKILNTCREEEERKYQERI